MSEKICTLSIDHAIRIAKIIATAPVARMPMITQLFQQASVDLEGLEELIENSSLTNQSQLVDTEEFVQELTTWRELTAKGYARFAKWRDEGIWEKIFSALSQDTDMENLSIDSTCVKVHESSNGGEKNGK